LKNHINEKELYYETEITMIQQQCKKQLEEKDQEMEELTMMMETRMRREI